MGARGARRERGRPVDGRASEARWAALGEEVLTGMRDWRAQHPRATLAEIETELDARLARLRARMLEDLALASAATAWGAAGAAGAEDAPRCAECGRALQARGRHPRRLRTQGGQELTLRRAYGVCPACGRGVFPPG